MAGSRGGIVELVETPTKLDRRHKRMRTLGVADPGDGGPWGWRTGTQENTDKQTQYKSEKAYKQEKKQEKLTQ